MFCNNCGFSVKDGAEFCQSCGKSLRETESAPKKELRLPEGVRKETEHISGKEASVSAAAPEKKSDRPESAVPEKARCVKCGEILPEGAVFCGNCGCRQEKSSGMKPERKAVRTEEAKAPVRTKSPVRTAPETPHPPKKGKKGKMSRWILGLAAVAVLVVLAVVVVRAVNRGPFYEMQRAFEKTRTADSFKVKMTVTADGANDINGSLIYIYNEQDEEVQIYVNNGIDNENIYSVCNTNGIFLVSNASSYSWADYVGSDDEYYSFDYDDENAIYEMLTVLHEDKNFDYVEDLGIFEQYIKYVNKSREASGEEEIEYDLFSDEMEKVVKEIQDTLKDEDVLKDIWGYEKSKDGKNVTYTFSPDIYELLKLYTDILEDHFDSDELEDFSDELEEFKDMLEDSEDDLDDMKLKMTVSIEDGFLSEIAATIKIDGETAKIRITVSDYNCAELPKSAEGFAEAMEECRDEYE